MVELRARAWVLDDHLEFPELELDAVRRRPNVGLCLSGGGTRSTCASVGYLRAFAAYGMLDRVRYLGAVSGGSWAAVPWLFWERGPSDDAELLGPLLRPGKLIEPVLEAAIPDTELSACATRSFRDALFDDLLEEGPGAAWIGAVGEVFLTPFGLYDPRRRRSYTLDERTRAELIARQGVHGSLRPEDLAVVRSGRPYPVIQSTLMGPSEAGELRRVEPLSMQFTPLYVGCPTTVEVELSYRRGQPVRRRIGGGLIEPFAFGGAGPLRVAGAIDSYRLADPEASRELAFMIGSSSTAYAEAIQKLPELRKHSGRVPAAWYWPNRTDNGLETELWEFGDGGLIDNYGLLPLLQRGIDRAIVLINTAKPLDLDYDPQRHSYLGRIDSFLPPLFGLFEEHDGLALARNQVFRGEDFVTLVRELQEAKRRGDPLVVVREHELVENPWWKIGGGRKLEVAWVYLDRVARFEAELPDDTRRAILAGHSWPRRGPARKFPNYDTIGANPGVLVQFTPYQIKLLSGLCSWVVGDRRAVFERLLA